MNRFKLLKILSYAFAFLLGMYCASEFYFDKHIEIYRWFITVFLFVSSLILSNDK